MSSTNCETCGIHFSISEKDKKFYTKMDVLEPKNCPQCRLIRRLAFRNVRKLYHNACELCSKKIISIYSPDKPYSVYCPTCWWGDSWDPLSYGRDFDFNRPFFEQLKELWDAVPKLSLVVLGDNINSDFTHDNYRLKNCYLVFDGEQAVDCYYGETFALIKNCTDFYHLYKSELCYECVNCINCYNVKYSRFCDNCQDSMFLEDCIGCKNCFGCSNLRNKQYYIFNQPHSKEEYEQKMNAFKSGSFQAVAHARKHFEEFSKKQPKKAIRGTMNENVTGDNLFGCKDSFESFDCRDMRDCKFCTNIQMGSTDSYDIDIWGDRMSFCYNSAGCGAGVTKIVGCYYGGMDSSDLYHCIFCLHNNHNLLGCVGLHHKKFCIFNKQYSEEEYQPLFEKIKAHMKETGEWGQFFPIQLSAFAYNESGAQDFFPLSQEEVTQKGYTWNEQPTMNSQQQTMNIPDNIQDTDDTIIKNPLVCASCNKEYKITAHELAFYKMINVPLPRTCFDCRHRERLEQKNPRKLADRNCGKCQKKITTASNVPEILCKECYKSHVY